MANFDLSKLTEGKNPQQVMLAERFKKLANIK